MADNGVSHDDVCSSQNCKPRINEGDMLLNNIIRKTAVSSDLFCELIKQKSGVSGPALTQVVNHC